MSEIKQVTVKINIDDRSIKDSVKEFDKLNKKIVEQEGILGQLQEKERQLLLIRSRSSDTKSIIAYNKELQNTRAAIASVENAGMKTQSSMSKMTTSLVTMGASLVSAFAIKAVVGDAVKRIMEFESSISSLSALTGSTGKDLEKLKGIVLSTAKETKKGASEVAKAFELVASAKPELLQDAEALSEVTKAAITLSKASGLDLVTAVNATTTGLAQFNMKANQSGEVIDALAAGAKYGASAIPETSQALEKFGAVADSSNLSIQDSVALVQTLADKQLKGSEAGTQLKNVILKLKNEGMGFVDGQFDMNAALEEAKAKFNAIIDPVKRSQEQTKLFGLESSVAGEILLNNIPKFKGFQKSVSEVGGAEEQAVIQTDNLKTQMSELDAQWGNFIVSMDNGDGVISKTMSGLVAMLDDAIVGLSLLNTSNETLIKNVKDGAFNEILSQGKLNAEETKKQLEEAGLSGDKLKESLLRAYESAKLFAKESKERGDKDLSKIYMAEAIALKELINPTAGVTAATTAETDAAAAAAAATNAQTAATKKLLAAKNDLKKGIFDNVSNNDQAPKGFTEMVDENVLKANVDLQNTAAQNDKDRMQNMADFKKNLSQEELDRTLKEQDDKIARDEYLLEKEAEFAQAKADLNGDIALSVIGLAATMSQLAGDSMEAQMAALGFEKLAAVVSVILNTAKADMASTASVAWMGLAAPAAAAVLIGKNHILSGISIATILATAIPQAAAIKSKKLAKGEVLISGDGTETSDSIPAMLSKNESIINARSSRKYTAALKAINDDRFDEYLNRVVMKKLYMGKEKSIIANQQQSKELISLDNITGAVRITNSAAISKGIRDVLQEYKFINQGAGWQ